MKRNKVVYIHRKLDNNEVFYVGMGSKKRAYEGINSKKRSSFWIKTVKKHGYIVEIVKEAITQKEAIDLEIKLILKYGRRDNNTGGLVNMTDGGEGGGYGRKISESHKKSISNAQKGIKKELTESRIKGHKERVLKITGSKRSQEMKDKMSKALKGRIFSKEWKDKISKSRIGGLNSRAKKVINTETLQVWGSASECADENKTNRNTFRSWMNGSKPNRSNFKYLENE